MGGPPPLPLTEGQTYCLRWNNHKSNLVEILDALIKVESYVDCTIVVDDQVQFKAHRVVLAANSPYFQAILQDVPMDHCSIIFPGVKAFEMRALLEYMYTGEVNVTQSQIPKIMRIAEELEVKGLFDMADLKEKFNKMGGDEHSERAPYATSGGSAMPSNSGNYTLPTTAPSASSLAQNGGKDGSGGGGDGRGGGGGGGGGNGDTTPLHAHQHAHSLSHTQPQNSSSVISTSTHISPPAAPNSNSNSSPPYSSYKSPYSNLYAKSPSALSANSSVQSIAAAAAVAAAVSTAQTSTTTHSHHTQSSSSASTQQSAERAAAERVAAAQWPISPSTAAAMLSSVYESAPDMNPLKRKKLSSISSMLMNRDTPILRNVLAQSNPADSSQPMPLLLPASTPTKNEKHSTTEKNSSHTALTAGGSHNNSHTFNGSTDYNSDKKYHDEPHSPYTDRSYDDDGYDPKGNYGGSGFGSSSSSSNQKPEWKRYKQYTRNDIMSAIQCVRDGMSALQASRKFGVPSRTLYDKVKKLGITTGRPMNRTMKRSPSNVESSAAFPYAHGYGQADTSSLLSSMHERDREERGEPKEHHRAEHHHMPPTIPHTAAALLDHAFLQQALENRGGDIAGREALHAMALAAAAHAAANRMSASPGPNGNGGRRTPSSPPSSFAMKYAPRGGDHEMLMEHEEKMRLRDEAERDVKIEDRDDEEDEHEEAEILQRRHERKRTRERIREHEMEIERELEREREREHERAREEALESARERANVRMDDANDETDDQVEDLSVTRKDSISPLSRHPEAPYTPPRAVTPENGGGVIVPPIHAVPSKASPPSPPAKLSESATTTSNANANNNSSSGEEFVINESNLKRELISDDGRAD